MKKLLTVLLATVSIGANAQMLPYQNPQLTAAWGGTKRICHRIPHHNGNGSLMG